MTKSEEYKKHLVSEYSGKVFGQYALECVLEELNHRILEDVEGLIDEFIPKITDECYINTKNGFRSYGIDCKLGREKLLTEIKTLKI